MKSEQPLHFFVVDDDDMILQAITALLEHEGYKVTACNDSRQAMAELPKLQPDCVISDLMMPEVDGYELCKFVRSHQALKDTFFIVLTAKSYEFDENRAYEFGAHGFLKKLNPETFIAKVKRIIDDRIEMQFWGVRGTLPVSGPGTLKYGGETNCMTLEFPRDQLFIFDGGTGVKRLGDHLMAQGRRAIKGRIFISHPHWDHINAMPFFTPLYIQGNEFQILGANQGDISMREIISAQMDGVYFPITLKEFAARIYFHDLDEEELDLDGGIKVRTKLLSHPGSCLGYRVEYNGRSVCYITDNELYLKDDPSHNPYYEEKLAEFIQGADALVTDSTYTDEEYKTKVGWGHSCISRVCDLAAAGEVKTLYLYHHDPDQDDDAIDAKLETASACLKERGADTAVIAPKVGDLFKL